MATSRAAAMQPAAPLRPGQRVPAASLPAVPDGRLVALREPARGAPVIVVLRSADPEEGSEVLLRLTQAHHSLDIWAGRPLVIVPASVENAARLVGSVDGVPFSVLADPDGEVRRRLGVPADRAALVIADRWGVVYNAVEADTARDLPPVDEVIEWVRYLATQCPECGVPDEPGRGEWGP
ncbi:MAG TPA: hypothetical protein VIL18_05675 [Longimicrobiales bacterium]